MPTTAVDVIALQVPEPERAAVGREEPRVPRVPGARFGPTSISTDRDDHAVTIQDRA